MGRIYIRVGHFGKNSERERDKSKQTTEQRRKKRRKKGEELEGKGQVLLEGRGTIGCYSVVSVMSECDRLCINISCGVKEWAAT